METPCFKFMMNTISFITMSIILTTQELIHAELIDRENAWLVSHNEGARSLATEGDLLAHSPRTDDATPLCRYMVIWAAVALMTEISDVLSTTPPFIDFKEARTVTAS